MELTSDADRRLMEWLSSRFQDPSAFGIIAEHETERAGFLLGRVDLWESEPPILKPRKMGMIDAVYVADRFRRRGIATLLIEHATEIIRDRNAVAVETVYEASGAAPHEIWRRAGFAPWMVQAHRML